MIPKKIKVVSVVVSFNAYKNGFFPRCLEEIDKVQLENQFYQIDHSVIVVDSHSGDRTAQKAAEAFPSMKVIASLSNLGYAGGNNRGFQDALGMGADYIAVVTQDVYVQPDWLIEAVTVAESDDKIGIVQPLLLLWPDKNLINSTGNHTHFLGYGYAGNYRMELSDYHSSHISDITYPSGAALLLSVKAIREVGDFDHEMWMYNEDQDLGWRMSLQGYRNVMASKSRVFHQYEFSRSISKMYYMDRNRMLAILQNYHWATLLLMAPVVFLNEIATFFLAWKGGWKKEKVAMWHYFVKKESWSKLLRKRRLRQGNRSVKERFIIKNFTGKILFQDVMSPVIKYVANPVLGAYWSLMKKVIFW